ncbi:unnamed protein product [Arabis nemorensis]|uniref:phosphoinositide phospholipase C n=1 Tax=Arabis nemorensis TaxID=586526 RepID=A0A565BH95_9BRAS|nr:unnamed protein product [Arabis nemorensis]
MKVHKTFEEHPPNSPGIVKDIVEAKFNFIGGKIPDLLSKFITLLGNEKEEWGGVAAMKACMNAFFSWKNGDPKQKDKVPIVKDLEEFLFSTNCYVQLVIQGHPDRPSTSMAVIQGAFDPPAIPKTVKGPNCPSTIKATTPKGVCPPMNPKTLKGTDRPSTSMAVNQDVVNNTHVPPASPKTLKVKIYMGTGWNNKDFRKLSSPPSLYVKLILVHGLMKQLKIDGGESHQTKVHTKTVTPCWGEEFVFPLSRPRDVNLIVEVYDHRSKQFAGKIGLLVSERKQGIHTILLSNQDGNPCTSRLVVRLMFD